MSHEFIQDTEIMAYRLPVIEGNRKVAIAECLINELFDVIQSMSKSPKLEDAISGKNRYDMLNHDGVPLEMCHQMREMAGLLQYMINCTSWRGEIGYKSFDAVRISEKLGYIKRYSDGLLDERN